jgi:hypothetical protein
MLGGRGRKRHERHERHERGIRKAGYAVQRASIFEVVRSRCYPRLVVVEAGPDMPGQMDQWRSDAYG